MVRDEVVVYIRKKKFPLGTYNKPVNKSMVHTKFLSKINDKAYSVELPKSFATLNSTSKRKLSMQRKAFEVTSKAKLLK